MHSSWSWRNTITASKRATATLSVHGLLRNEYFILALMSILGMLVMVSGHSLLTLYLGLEIMSLSLYALIATARDRAFAIEAALKYFVLGAIASGLLLYGMSMIYGITGKGNGKISSSSTSCLASRINGRTNTNISINSCCHNGYRWHIYGLKNVATV